MPERGFSEVTLTFNKHLGNLNRARIVFERETKELNEFVWQHLDEFVNRPNEHAIQKVRWSDPRDTSTARDVAWTNFVAGTQLSMDIRQPGYKIFRRAASYVYFESVFHDPSDEFVFQCRFENQNLVHADIDEEIISQLNSAPDGEFPGHEHVKTNTAILFRREFADELFQTINQMVDGSIRIVEAAIDQIFPDSLYIDSDTVKADDEVPVAPPGVP